MDPNVMVALGGVLLLLLLLAGTPVFVVFLVVNLIGCAVLFGPNSYGIFIDSLNASATSLALVTVPMFLLMGEILFRSGTVEVLLKSIDSLIGRLWGRQYFVSVVLSTVFGALSGSAVAVAAMLGRSLLPTMLQNRYDAKLSAGTILAGASLAPIIPPSILVILLGSLANVSIAGLMVAGVLPGLLIAGLCCAYLLIRGRLNKSLAPAMETSGVSYRPAQIAVNILPFTFLMFVVIGLIILGVATPTESASLGVVGAMLIAALYKRLNISILRESLISAVKLSAMLIVILATSKVLGQLLAFAGSTVLIVENVAALDIAPMLMLILLLLIPFLLCMFLDQIALMLILIPVYVPLVSRFGFESIWFWTLFLIILTLGSITPPFGYTLFALKGTSDHLTIVDIYRASIPFVAVFLIAILAMILMPQIVMWLPGKM